MATISDLYTHLNTLTKKWFYTKSEIKNIALTGKATDLTDSTAHSNIGSTANSTQANINTKIDTELGKKANTSDLSTVATTGKYSDLTNIPSTFTPSAHTHSSGDVKDSTAHSNIGSSANDTQSTINTKIDTALGTKANTSSLKTVATTGKYSDLTGIPSTFTPSTHTHSSSEITDSTAYSRLGTSAGATQATINNAINTKIGALLDVDLITVVSSLGTASASTMNKLYLVAESTSKTNDSYEIYVTVRTGSSGNYSYAWEKVDTARIDLSGYSTTDHAHGNITKEGKVGTTANKPLITGTGGAVTAGNFEATATNIKMNGTQSVGSANTFARGDHVHPTDTSRAASTHTHGNLQNNGQVGTTAAANKNVVTDANGKITTENKYSHPTYTARTGKPTDDQTPSFGGTVTVSQITSDTTGHVTGATDREILIPDTIANGTIPGLSTNDYTTNEKTKLSGIATGATKNTIDTAMSSTSTNAVQNKAVKAYVDNAIEGVIAGDIDLGTTHNHTLSQITDYTIDSALSTSSTNPVENQAVATAFNGLSTVATTGDYTDLINTPSETGLYNEMGDLLDQYYIFSKYDSSTGELSLGKLGDIGAVNLTTETNAVVTDDTITYTATVTDTENDTVSGVYVEFFEDDKLIGSATTNDNGVATLSKVYTDSVICDVTAKIGSQTSDLTMFVKDKDLTYIFYDLGYLNHHNDNWTYINHFTRLSDYTIIHNHITGGNPRYQAGDSLTGTNYIITFKNHGLSDNNDYLIFQHSSSQTAISFNTAHISGECDVKITFNKGKVYVSVNNGESLVSLSLKDDLDNGWNFRFGINNGGNDIYFSEFIIIQNQ